MKQTDRPRRLCIVIQRYGTEIMGGAESYARIYAERLLQHGHDVEVIATCALDYQQWENYYPEGTAVVNGVPVHRFRVDKYRDMALFAALTERIYGNPWHSLEQADEWLHEQGPQSSGLIAYLKQHYDDYDLFLFMTYMYYPTTEGLPLAAGKAVLVPFAHDEPAIYVRGYDRIFKSPRGIVFNTPEERETVYARFHNEAIPAILTGIGLDIPPLDTLPDAKEQFGLNDPFILYMGRIDASKGCDRLFEDFLAYKKAFGGRLKLVLIGSDVLPIPEHKDIVFLGFVSEEEKYAILRECMMLVLPSEFESLSIVVLEAMALARPVLVNGRCAVLRGHCQKSNAGLYYFEQADFLECLSLLSGSAGLRAGMGANGVAYVESNYRWDTILSRMDDFFEELIAAGEPSEAGRKFGGNT